MIWRKSLNSPRGPIPDLLSNFPPARGGKITTRTPELTTRLCRAELALTGFSPVFLPFFACDGFEQRLHVLGMLFLFGENALHHSPAGGIIVRQVANDLGIGFDGNQ